MRQLVIVLGLLLICLPGGARAAPRQIQFGPPASEVGFRAYGLGLLPIDASFTRFQGHLTYDPDDMKTCRVDLTVDVASLSTGDPSVRSRMVGPDFMDAERFPALVYSGSCGTGGIGGSLGMHGITRPFDLELTWHHGDVVAEGRLLRAEWGMTAMPILAGRTVRIRVAVALPGPTQTRRDQ
jgi:polyisoprenoid-binding protein YceI